LKNYVLDNVQSVKIIKGKITPKSSKAELRFFCPALLFNEINLPTKFHVDNAYGLWHCYDSFSSHFYSMRSIYLQIFMLISLIVLELCPDKVQSVPMRGFF
jgi:hypothetical protein